MNKTNRFLVVHGHFYQPPRENPWIESVETQDSAAPYHDWNERITSECYARNGASRIVNLQNQILRIVNNYAQMSFNFGPTLLSWLQEHAELTYKSILEADRLSQERFSGHGSAMAQVYNHIIMPLANRRDKELQVRWGVADFESRFGRKPEGMWLAETAADTESLEVLAEHGIVFTVLAPHQCAAVRPLPRPVTAGAATTQTEPAWLATPNDSVDTRRPYRIVLPSGRSIVVFFYDGARSRAIAFERLLDSGEGFALRMAGGFSSTDPASPELVHVATDGESYGHHHRFGEMALSYALQFTESEKLATVTNYGEFLAKFPPEWEAQIAEQTSWSCAHGVERWRSNCGCNGGKPGWNQRWRTALREGLDLLRDTTAPLAATMASELFRDWEKAGDHFIQVVLDRAQSKAFLEAERVRPLSHADETQALKLLELVRHAQLMYTSCGWFFDDISGIETVQIIAYAARVLELAADLFGAEVNGLEERFLEILSKAESNAPGEGTGADIYRREVQPLRVGLDEVAAHYAVSSVFQAYPEHARIFAFSVDSFGQEVQNSGRGRLISGEANIASALTHEHERLFYAVLHFGDQNIAAGVKRCRKGTREAHAMFTAEAHAAMLAADLPAVIRLFDKEFDGTTYTIRSLFTDEQRRVMQLILNNTVAEAEESLLHVYDDHASLLHFLSQAAVPQPSALKLAANFAINVRLRRAIASDPIDAGQMRAALALAAQDGIELDRQELSFTADGRMRDAMAALQQEPASRTLLDEALSVAEALQLLPFEANIWQAQNIWNSMDGERQRGAIKVSDSATFQALGAALSISLSMLSAPEPR